jgi:hypothetical protein
MADFTYIKTQAPEEAVIDIFHVCISLVSFERNDQRDHSYPYEIIPTKYVIIKERTT